MTSPEDWWATDIIDMRPGVIRYRGEAIEDLIGQLTFTDMIAFMVLGEKLTPERRALLDAALMAAVDHGPQAPSIAIARMAVTCGVGLNNAMASAINVLGDVHGGAGEQAVRLYHEVDDLALSGTPLNVAVDTVIRGHQQRESKYLPGFGHRFHPVDPRAPRLLELVDQAAASGTVSGQFATIARTIEQWLAEEKGRPIPLNIDGATAVIYAELGIPAPLARGLFCLSRSVGILTHAWEQTQQGGRNKGPLPKGMLWTYTGPNPTPDNAE